LLAVIEDAGFAARLAGGCVRDQLLGIEPNDFDIACTAPPVEMEKLALAANLRTVPTGIDHGTLTFLMPAGPIEVTTLRRDVATDGRRAVVAFSTDFREDAMRRDFTINAMYIDRHGTLYDFFGGEADLHAKILRFVGDAETRMQEDYLRILRYYRFRARLGFEGDATAAVPIKNHAADLKNLSAERVTNELLQTLDTQKPEAMLQEMSDIGVLAVVLPNSAIPKDNAIDQIQLSTGKRAIARLALLCRHNLDNCLGGLRLSNGETKAAQTLVKSAAESQKLTATAEQLLFLDKCERQCGWTADELIHFWQTARTANWQNYATAQQRHGHRRLQAPPMNGHTVMETLGLGPGPSVEKILKDARVAFYLEEWSTLAEGRAWLQAKHGSTQSS
jgi:poly(A) polymerase